MMRFTSQFSWLRAGTFQRKFQFVPLSDMVRLSQARERMLEITIILDLSLDRILD